MTREETESRMVENRISVVLTNMAAAYQVIRAASKAQADLVWLRQELAELCEKYAANQRLIAE